MSVIQILLILFAAFALGKAVARFRRGALPLGHLALWAAFWIGVIVVVIRPETSSAVARFLGVGRGADVVVYLALVAAFYLLFKMFARVEEIERQLTKIVREAALKDLDDRER